MHNARSEHAYLGMGIHKGAQRRQCTRANNRIGIQKQDIFGLAARDRLIRRRTVTGIARIGEKERRRESRSHHLGAAIRGRIVDDDELAGRFPLHALKTPPQ
jgi:hypothetical protein